MVCFNKTDVLWTHPSTMTTIVVCGSIITLSDFLIYRRWTKVIIATAARGLWNLNVNMLMLLISSPDGVIRLVFSNIAARLPEPQETSPNRLHRLVEVDLHVLNWCSDDTWCIDPKISFWGKISRPLQSEAGRQQYHYLLSHCQFLFFFFLVSHSISQTSRKTRKAARGRVVTFYEIFYFILCQTQHWLTN